MTTQPSPFPAPGLGPLPPTVQPESFNTEPAPPPPIYRRRWLLPAAVAVTATVLVAALLVIVSQRNDLADAETNLGLANTELDATRDDLTDTNTELGQTETANQVLSDDLAAARDELADTEDELASLTEGTSRPFMDDTELRDNRERAVAAWELIATAPDLDTVLGFAGSFDAVFDRFVAGNVRDEDVACKTVIANAGYTFALVVAATYIAYDESGDQALIDDLQLSLVGASTEIGSAIDAECGWSNTGTET